MVVGFDGIALERKKLKQNKFDIHIKTSLNSSFKKYDFDSVNTDI